MTGADFLAYVKRTFKRTDKDTELYEAITDTILDMKMRCQFDRFKTEAYSASISTAGDYNLDVPSDLGAIIGDVRVIDGDDSRALTKVGKERFDELYPDPNMTSPTTAMPLHWCLFGEQFLFGPVPDKTTYKFEFSYTTEAVELIVAGTTSVPFSGAERECLKAGALYRIFREIENGELAEYWRIQYEGADRQGGFLAQVCARERANSGATACTQYQDI